MLEAAEGGYRLSALQKETPMATATAAVKRMYIDGKWCDADSGRTLGVINPATEDVLAEVAYGGRAEVRRALEAAQRALPGWMKMTAWDRGKILKKTAELMRERADAIARTMTMEQGKPLAESKAEMLHSADTFEWFGEEGKRAYGQVIPHSVQGKRHITLKHPVGVVGAISPWNFPITLQSRKIAPALAAGCTVVSKPASQTPLCLMQVFECLIEAGLPQGVANLVMGPAQEIADEFLENPVGQSGLGGSSFSNSSNSARTGFESEGDGGGWIGISRTYPTGRSTGCSGTNTRPSKRAFTVIMASSSRLIIPNSGLRESRGKSGATREVTATAFRTANVDSIVGTNQVGHAIPFIRVTVPTEIGKKCATVLASVCLLETMLS